MDEYGDESSENDFIRDVMASMGWSDSFLPIASEENKKLLDAIKFLGKTKLARDDDLETQSREELRVENLLKNVDNEFDQNLKLVTAHKSQYVTEHHLLKLAEHEHSKYRQMSKEIAKETTEFNHSAEKLKGTKDEGCENSYRIYRNVLDNARKCDKILLLFFIQLTLKLFYPNRRKRENKRVNDENVGGHAMGKVRAAGMASSYGIR